MDRELTPFQIVVGAILGVGVVWLVVVGWKWMIGLGILAGIALFCAIVHASIWVWLLVFLIIWLSKQPKAQ